MPTSDLVRRTPQDRSVRSRKHASHKASGKSPESSAYRKRTVAFHNDRWALDQGKGTTVLMCPRKHTIFSQGDAADAVFYVQSGKVKLTVVSSEGKAAVVAILDGGAFLGESCLAGQAVQLATATAVEDCSLVRIDKDAMIWLLQEQPRFAECFLSYLLTHSMRLQEDFADHLFNNSERRLARVLLRMARFGKEGKPAAVIPKVNQETLAEMIGTTRSRISFFMNRFRKLGFIDYGCRSKLFVRRSLRRVVLHDK